MAHLDAHPTYAAVPAAPWRRSATEGGAITALEQPEVGRGFEDPEGLRRLLERLHRGGDGAWRSDGEAAELMRFCARRYAGLAVKYGLDRDDAAVAAFEAMRNPSTRTASNPWAVVTVAVRITLIAEHRAHGLLTSPHRARRARYTQFHDPERFSDRDTDLATWHPSLRTTDPADTHDESEVGPAGRAIDDAVTFLTLLGWSPDLARGILDHVAARLAETGDRTHAAAVLHRDHALPVLLGLTQVDWNAVVRLLLGTPTSPHFGLRAGLLARLLTGETIRQLLHDDTLVRATLAPLPNQVGGDQ